MIKKKWIDPTTWWMTNERTERVNRDDIQSVASVKTNKYQ